MYECYKNIFSRTEGIDKLQTKGENAVFSPTMTQHNPSSELYFVSAIAHKCNSTMHWINDKYNLLTQ